MKSSSSRKSRSSQPRSSGRQQQAASGAGGQYGEGNYAATKQYNEGLKEHMEGHDIDKEAREAAPKSAAEENEMLAAERKGRARARDSEEAPGSPDDQTDIER